SDKNNSSITGTAPVKVTSTRTSATSSSPTQDPSGFAAQLIRHGSRSERLPLDVSGQAIAILAAYDNPYLFTNLTAFDRQSPSSSTRRPLQRRASSPWPSVLNARSVHEDGVDEHLLGDKDQDWFLAVSIDHADQKSREIVKAR